MRALQSLRLRFLTAAFAMAVVGVPRLAAPQNVALDSTRRGALFTRTDAVVLGSAALVSGALMESDEGITRAFRDSGPQGSVFLRRGADVFNFLGGAGTVIASAGLYAGGRWLHHPRVATLGLRSAEALVIAGAETWLIKGLVGRARPFVDERDADDTKFGRGFRQGRDASFPSGHATAAFAFATVLTMQSRQWWPHATRYVAPLSYAGATAVALARVYADKHWASDVVAGAGIGTATGLLVVSYHQLHPHSRLDRWLLSTMVVSDGRRLVVSWSTTTP